MQSIQDQIEKLIDDNSLTAFKKALANVCLEKAEHIQANWQDSTLAHEWEKAGQDIGNINTDNL